MGVNKVRRRATSIPYRQLIWPIWEEEMDPFPFQTDLLLNKSMGADAWPQMHTGQPAAFRRLAACN